MFREFLRPCYKIEKEAPKTRKKKFNIRTLTILITSSTLFCFHFQRHQQRRPLSRSSGWNSRITPKWEISLLKLQVKVVFYYNIWKLPWIQYIQILKEKYQCTVLLAVLVSDTTVKKAWQTGYWNETFTHCSFRYSISKNTKSPVGNRDRDVIMTS